jgi:hypothetical protein
MTTHDYPDAILELARRAARPPVLLDFLLERCPELREELLDTYEQTIRDLLRQRREEGR